VLHFDTEEMNGLESISMAGQEMDAEVDDKLYRDVLECTLKVI